MHIKTVTKTSSITELTTKTDVMIETMTKTEIMTDIVTRNMTNTDTITETEEMTGNTREDMIETVTIKVHITGKNTHHTDGIGITSIVQYVFVIINIMKNLKF